MLKIQEEIKNAPSVQLLTTLYSYIDSKSKSKKMTALLIENELKSRGVII